jgi:hypothetical protein
MEGEEGQRLAELAEAELAHARELRRDKIVLAVFVVIACAAIGLWRLAGG